MPKRRRAAMPVAPQTVVKSRKRARQIVTSFHKLEEELRQTQTDGSIPKSKKEQQRRNIEAAMKDLGGRAAYQAASQLSVSYHNTSKWVLRTLRQHEVLPKRGMPPLRVLEVGAINTTLLDCPLLQVDAIDLLSRHERIIQRDFFDMVPAASFDVVVSSMVVNAVPDAGKRGEMLMGYNRHLKTGGHLCLMLPLSCLTHAGAGLTPDRFSSMLTEGLGFHIVLTRESPKVMFYFCRKEKEVDVSYLKQWGNSSCQEPQRKKKTKSSQGVWLKDFAISFPSPAAE